MKPFMIPELYDQVKKDNIFYMVIKFNLNYANLGESVILLCNPKNKQDKKHVFFGDLKLVGDSLCSYWEYQ